jgi:hypothetical protein
VIIASFLADRIKALLALNPIADMEDAQVVVTPNRSIIVEAKIAVEFSEGVWHVSHVCTGAHVASALSVSDLCAIVWQALYKLEKRKAA